MQVIKERKLIPDRISAKEEISSKTGKEGSIYPGRCRQGLSEDWHLSRDLEDKARWERPAQGRSTEKQAGWVSGGAEGWFVRGRGRAAGLQRCVSQVCRFWFQCNGKAPLVPEMTGSVSEDDSHTIEYHFECKSNSMDTCNDSDGSQGYKWCMKKRSPSWRVTNRTIPFIQHSQNDNVIDKEFIDNYRVDFQYSCLENPMDKGAWWATVHRVAKSQTWLKQLSRHPYRVDARGQGKKTGWHYEV